MTDSDNTGQQRDVREHIAHKPKYAASADDLAALATEAREAADD